MENTNDIEYFQGDQDGAGEEMDGDYEGYDEDLRVCMVMMIVWSVETHLKERIIRIHNWTDA